MAKKKSKKKDNKKKDNKKKVLKLKLKNKKETKKKEAKKKEAKKKDKKKKEKKKKSPKKKPSNVNLITEKPSLVKARLKDTPVIKNEDHSSNYNAKDALLKLRSLKSRDEITAFTKGEKRITVTKAMPVAFNRLR